MTQKRKNVNLPQETATDVNRRGFMACAATAAASVSVIKPELVFGYSANEKIRVGISGCGGRGTWITGLFANHGGYEIAAAADYFKDRVDDLGDKFKVAADRRYMGLAGYQRMLEGKLDALVIESPPYFHPQQAADGVEAGCHVYLAKPLAVDVPGCGTVEESGKKATAKKLCFLVDFQTRADEFYMESIKRVHAGALGDLAFGESTYHAGVPWVRQIKYLEDDPKNPENRLRAWGLDQVLSGDIITEQNIHTLDVASWIMNGPPECAFGTGGRKVRKYGDCYDTFSITFQYPGDIGIAFSSRQFAGHGTQPEGIRNRMFGSDGVLETAYGDTTMIRGKHFYRGGKSPGIYKEGAVVNIATFHDSIQNADYTNPTVPEGVRSNLVTILGRTAAYEKRVVTWDEMLKKNEKLDPGLKGLKD